MKWRSAGAGAPFAGNDNKANQLFVLLLPFFVRPTRVDVCSGIPAHTPEIERLINAPLTGLGLKEYTHTRTTLDALMCARVHYCWYNVLYVISAQPPVYVKGDNKRHMNSNKAQPQSINTSSPQSQCCNLNPVFKSCVYVCVYVCTVHTCTCVCVHSNKNQFLESIICTVG